MSLKIHLSESIIKRSDCEKLRGEKLTASISSSKPLIKSILTHNLINAHWFGCFTAVRKIRELSICITDERCLWLIQNEKLSSYEELLEQMSQSLFIIETSRALI